MSDSSDKWNGHEEITCPICLNEISDRSTIDACRHSFCFNCIVEWSLVKTCCPMCRSDYETVLRRRPGETSFEVVRMAPSQEEIRRLRDALSFLVSWSSTVTLNFEQIQENLELLIRRCQDVSARVDARSDAHERPDDISRTHEIVSSLTGVIQELINGLNEVISAWDECWHPLAMLDVGVFALDRRNENGNEILFQGRSLIDSSMSIHNLNKIVIEALISDYRNTYNGKLAEVEKMEVLASFVLL